ncbi:MAG: hypothetical protein H0U44_01190 [Flavisolibacter sp.]|jgi:hypothetical protein|nr:hypothetical protein [Flavisolibacter sp.]
MARMNESKLASGLMTGLLVLTIIFHLLVLLQIIPYTIVWAGRLNNLQEMYVFEAISILLNLLLLWVIVQKAGYIKSVITERYLNMVLWLFVIIFALNTIGNLFSKNQFEFIFGTAFTLLSSLLCWLIVRKANPGYTKG